MWWHASPAPACALVFEPNVRVNQGFWGSPMTVLPAAPSWAWALPSICLYIDLLYNTSNHAILVPCIVWRLLWARWAAGFMSLVISKISQSMTNLIKGWGDIVFSTCIIGGNSLKIQFWYLWNPWIYSTISCKNSEHQSFLTNNIVESEAGHTCRHCDILRLSMPDGSDNIFFWAMVLYTQETLPNITN